MKTLKNLENNLFKKLYLFFIALALLLNVVYFGTSVFEAHQATKFSALNKADEKILEREIIFNDFINYNNNILYAVRDSKEFTSYLLHKYDQKSIEEFFLTFTKSNQYIFQFRYIDKNGKERVRVDRKKFNEKAFIVSQNDLQDKSNRYYFYDSKLKPLEKTWLSNLDLNMEHGKVDIPFRPTIRIMLPISNNNQFDGILILNLFMNDFINKFINMPVFNARLINASGDILVSTFNDESWSAYAQSKNTIKDIFPTSYKDILQNRFFENSEIKSKRLNIETPLKLFLVLSVDDESIHEGINEIILNLVLYGVIILIISLLFAYSFAKIVHNLVDMYTRIIKENANTINQNILYSRTDPKGIITEASDVFCKLSGYSRDELIGQRHSIVRHPDTSSTVFKSMWKTIQSGKIWKGEIKNKAKDGHYYWLEATVSPEYDENDNLIGYLSIRHDITAKKEFESQQILLNEQAKLASMGEMIGNIAHQWRQPLSAISIQAGTLGIKYETNTLTQSDVEEIEKNIIEKTQYLSKTIDTFRDFIKGGNKKEETSICEAIEEGVNLIKDTFLQHHIELKIQEHREEICTKKILIPKHEFAQVIINILNNAKDALIENNVENAWVEIKHTLKDDTIIVTIEDNGGGIPEDIMSKIFEPYFTTKHQSQGTGLGLNMSFKIITQSMGGNLYANNTQNGAIFTIELPLDD